jgi:hypothetical protein
VIITVCVVMNRIAEADQRTIYEWPGRKRD